MSTGRAGTERRRFRRIALRVTVRYAPRQFGENVPPDLYEGKTVDISRSGVALEIPHRLRLGGTVELALIQQDPPRCISVTGDVVRCSAIPGSRSVDGEGMSHHGFLVAINFSRILEISEISNLHDAGPLDSTEVQEMKKEGPSAAGQAPAS
jgi:hypothetical protein